MFEVLEARGLADRATAVLLEHLGQFARPEGDGIAIDVDHLVTRVQRAG